MLCHEMPMTTVADTLGQLDTLLWCMAAEGHRSGPCQKFLAKVPTNLG